MFVFPFTFHEEPSQIVCLMWLEICSQQSTTSMKKVPNVLHKHLRQTPIWRFFILRVWFHMTSSIMFISTHIPNPIQQTTTLVMMVWRHWAWPFRRTTQSQSFTFGVSIHFQCVFGWHSLTWISMNTNNREQHWKWRGKGIEWIIESQHNIDISGTWECVMKHHHQTQWQKWFSQLGVMWQTTEWNWKVWRHWVRCWRWTPHWRPLALQVSFWLLHFSTLSCFICSCLASGSQKAR